MKHLQLHGHPLSMMALSLAFAVATPHARAATFEGSILGDGVALATSPADVSVFANQGTAYNGPTAFLNSAFEGDVASGYSSVSAVSDGSVAKTVVSTLVFRQAVSNPLGQSQAVAFSFMVPSTTTTIDLGNSSNITSFSALASFTGTISWGGTVLWSMDYGVGGMGSVAAGGGSFYATGAGVVSASGTVPVGPVGGTGPFLKTGVGGEVGLAGAGFVVLPAYSGNVNLGNLGAFQTEDLVYTLSATATYEATYNDPSAVAALGYGGFAQPGNGVPFSIEFTPNGTGDGVHFPGFTSAVPEPSAAVLMAAGLGLLVGRKRRASRAA